MNGRIDKIDSAKVVSAKMKFLRVDYEKDLENLTKDIMKLRLDLRNIGGL